MKSMLRLITLLLLGFLAHGRVIQGMQQPIEAELDNLTKQGRIEFTDRHFERAEQEIQRSLRNGDQARANRFKVYIEKVRRLESKNSFSGFLKYHCTGLYTLGDTLYNPLLYGLAGMGISSATGFELEKGFLLGASAAATAKILNTAKNFYNAEVNQQQNNRSWHLPITGLLKKHTAKNFLLYGIVGLGLSKLLGGSTNITASLLAGISGTSGQRFSAWAF